MTEKEIIWHDIQCLKIATKIMCFGGRKEDVFKMLGYLKDPLAWKKVCDTIELRYNDGSHYTKDEHGRFTGSTSSGGGGSSSGGGTTKTRYKFVRGTVPVSNEQINSLLNNEFQNIRFSHEIVYNSRIATPGKTVGEFSPLGRCKKIKSIEIGKQYTNRKETLMDTIIHEELEARIMLRSNYYKKYKKLNTVSDNERHKYINRAIKKYFSLKGWDYGLV